MSKKYCFDINNPNGIKFDINQLKKFVEALYIGKKKNQFSKDEKLPFVIIYARADNSVCILMTSRSKKNIERVENINRKIKARHLHFENGITLEEPYEFDVDIATWWKVSKKSKKEGYKWFSLRQRGPYFINLMEPYEPLGATLTYDGIKYTLTPQEEKIATLYAKRKISEMTGGVVDEWTKEAVFNKNFWRDFKKYLSPANKKVFKKFDKIDWKDLITSIELDKANGLTSEEKIIKKIRNEEKKSEYGFAWLDGKREKVGNFIVEPQAIFYGRGNNPNRGKIKREITPEDVTINIGEKDPIPKPPAGHRWGAIVHDHSAIWLAKWNDSITGDTKYVMFSAEGRFKGEADLIKYEKARKIDMYIDTVRERYMVDSTSRNAIKMQLGTVLYLIDHFGVRVGNERKIDEADTVGASTLRVGHVKLKKPDQVIFDFLGKDSIRFYKILTVPYVIYDNFAKLLQGKKKSEQVFHSISSRSINTYLKEFDKSFSAKVFRTRLASKIMFDALKDLKIPKRTNKARTKIMFNKANAKVATVLNHTRNVSKKAHEAVKKYRIQLKEVENHIKIAKKIGKNTKVLKKRKESLKNKIESKTDVMTVAINTSLANYIDPRMIVAWSKQNNIDLGVIYTSTLIRKFKWAIENTHKDWNWEKSPLIGNSELEPLEEEGTAVQISQEDKPPKPNYIKSKKNKYHKITKPFCTNNYPKLSITNKLPKITIPVLNQHSTVADYELLLRICKEPEKYKKKLYKVPKNVMEWIVHFSRYAINKGIQLKANKYIVQFYDAVYKNRN